MVTMDDDGWWGWWRSRRLMVHHSGRKYVGLMEEMFLQFGDPTASSRRDVLHLIKNILPLLHSKDSSPGKGGGDQCRISSNLFRINAHRWLSPVGDEIRKGFNTD